jgi:hypothetical protein
LAENRTTLPERRPVRADAEHRDVAWSVLLYFALKLQAPVGELLPAERLGGRRRTTYEIGDSAPGIE